MPRVPLAIALLALFLAARLDDVSAQELKTHPTPFSVWLDFDKLSRPNPPKVALPIWIEAVQSESKPAKNGTPAETVYRIRLRRMEQLHSEIQLRVFFDDRPGQAPAVSGWSETGQLRYQSVPLGHGLDLPSSLSLNVPVEGVDYVDITVPGDGVNVRGVFVASLRRVEGRAGIDFATPPLVTDAFGAAEPARTETDDFMLYGRVKATLEAGAVKLEPATGLDGITWEVQLDAPPMAALVTFEVLGADITLPPELIVNEHMLGGANMQLPDLADPAFQGDVRPMERDMRFRYTGWLRCQKLIPGSALKSGLNRVRLRLNNSSGPVAVRAVEVQLKHHWQDFDYTVTP
jgi:hypothetical protein